MDELHRSLDLSLHCWLQQQFTCHPDNSFSLQNTHQPQCWLPVLTLSNDFGRFKHVFTRTRGNAHLCPKKRVRVTQNYILATCHRKCYAQDRRGVQCPGTWGRRCWGRRRQGWSTQMPPRKVIVRPGSPDSFPNTFIKEQKQSKIPFPSSNWQLPCCPLRCSGWCCSSSWGGRRTLVDRVRFRFNLGKIHLTSSKFRLAHQPHCRS